MIPNTSDQEKKLFARYRPVTLVYTVQSGANAAPTQNKHIIYVNSRVLEASAHMVQLATIFLGVAMLHIMLVFALTACFYSSFWLKYLVGPLIMGMVSSLLLLMITGFKLFNTSEFSC